MRLVKITTPVVFTTDIVELLLADGIAEVSLHGTSRMSGVVIRPCWHVAPTEPPPDSSHH